MGRLGKGRVINLHLTESYSRSLHNRIKETTFVSTIAAKLTSVPLLGERFPGTECPHYPRQPLSCPLDHKGESSSDSYQLNHVVKPVISSGRTNSSSEYCQNTKANRIQLSQILRQTQIHRCIPVQPST